MTIAKGLAKQSVTGLKWNSVGSLVNVLCTLVIGAVLARILGPRPYGLFMAGGTILGIASQFADGGLGTYLVQKAEIEEHDVRLVFSLQMIAAIALAAIISTVAPWLSLLFHDRSTISVIRVMSLIIILQATGLTSAALLKRDLRFGLMQRCMLTSYLASFILVGLPLAYLGAGVWSLVIAYLVQSFLSSVLMYWSARHSLKPLLRRLPPSMCTYSWKLVATNFVNWGHGNLDNVAVANRLGPVALGLYGRMYGMALSPSTSIVGGIQSVLLSATARLSHKRDVIGEMAVVSTAITAGILGPIYFTIAMIPRTVVLGVYGEKWETAIPILVPLALATPIYACMCMMGPLLNGIARPELEMWPQIITGIVAGGTYLAAANHSVTALAWAVFSIYILRFLWLAWNVVNIFKIPVKIILSVFVRGTICAALFGLIMRTIDSFLMNLLWSQGLILIVIIFIAALFLLILISKFTDLIFGREVLARLATYHNAFPALVNNLLIKENV